MVKKVMAKVLALVLLVAAAGFVGGPAASVKVEAQDNTEVPMYRLFNPWCGEHFYTAKAAERDVLVRKGWNYEGIGWFAPAYSSIPVYRLFNRYSGDHHYTMNAKERDWLVSLGWNYEGIGWYSDENKTVPLYRQFNPLVKIGTHNYTTNKGENDYLATIGWNAEGIAWYALKAGIPINPGSSTSGSSSSSSSNYSGDATIENDSAYASIEADVYLKSTPGNGAHAKLLMGGQSAIASFGIQYDKNNASFSTKTYFILENIYDMSKAATPGPEGKAYTIIAQANRDTTYRLRLSWDKATNILHCYVNGEEMNIEQSGAKTNMHPKFILGCEGSAMKEGDQIDATFSNVKTKVGDSSDGKYGAGSLLTEGYHGLTGQITSQGSAAPSAQFGSKYNWGAHIYGIIGGIGGKDWDTSFLLDGKPNSGVVKVVQK